MLEYMSTDSRNIALSLLEGGDDSEAYGSPNGTTWDNVRNPNDKHTNVTEDHYGRSYFSQAPSSSQYTQTPNTKRRKVH